MLIVGSNGYGSLIAHIFIETDRNNADMLESRLPLTRIGETHRITMFRWVYQTTRPRDEETPVTEFSTMARAVGIPDDLYRVIV